jgi:hypothetical protein
MAIKESGKDEVVRETTAEKTARTASPVRETEGATERRRGAKSISDLYSLARTTDVIREEVQILKGVKEKDLVVKDNGDGTFDVKLRTKNLRLQRNLLLGETDPRRSIVDPQTLRVLESKGADTKEYMNYTLPIMRDLNKFILELFVSTVIIADNDKTDELGNRSKSAIEQSGGPQALQAFMSGLNSSGLLFKDMMTLSDDQLVSAMAGMGDWNYASALDTSLGNKIDESVEVKTGTTVIMDSSTAGNRRVDEDGPAIFDRAAISRVSPRMSKLSIKE